MKRFFVVLLLVSLLIPSGLADTLPIYHAPSGLSAPYEKVQELNESPLAADAETMRIDYVGIRQGDCIVVRVGGMTMLIDGGEGWRVNNVIKYLEANDIDGFDIMFLTHAHDDHIEMQEELIKKGYYVGKVISPYTEEDNYSLWNGYKKLLKEKNIPFETIKTGDTLEFGGATFTFYRWDNKKQTMNNHSVTAMLQYGDARVMLTADIGGETQHWLMENFDPELFKCDIYKAAHHGRTAAVPDFLTAMDPGLVVVTNTKSSTATHDKQLDGRNIARYYISTGTICTETDGSQWYVWLEPLE